MSVEENQKHIAEFIRYAEADWFEPGEPHVLPPRFVRALRLMKAAPELLEACKHAAHSYHHPACKCRGEYSANPELYCTCHVQKAHAAIAAVERE